MLCCFGRPPAPKSFVEELRLGFARMLRHVEPLSRQRLTTCFDAKLSLARQHPLLAMALRRDLRLVPHLAAVLEWQRLLRRHFELRLPRHQARSLRMGDALQKLPPQGRQLFEDFKLAWKECAKEGCMARYGCKELAELPEIDLNTPLSLSCADGNTDEGSYILAMMQSLVEKQNSFLKEAE